MERKLFDRIIQVVVKAVTEAMMRICEKYITADELCEQFQMFSKGWLKAYGDRLPRQRAEVMDEGVKVSRWAYPQHKIARMIQDGSIKEL